MSARQEASRLFKQAIPSIGLSVEQATEAAPDDGNYHVIVNGEVVFSSSSKTGALQRYRALRDEALAGATAQARVIYSAPPYGLIDNEVD